jgi:hypothetical protein
MLLNKVPCPDVGTHGIKSNNRSLSLEVYIASRFLKPKARMDRILDNTLDILSLIKIIIHIESLICPRVQPFSTIHKGRKLSFFSVSEVVTPKFVLKAFHFLSMVM